MDKEPKDIEGQQEHKIDFQVEVDSQVAVIGFIPQGEQKADSASPPLADRYKVLLPQSLSEIKDNPMLTKFLDVFLRQTAARADTFHYVWHETVKDHPSGRYGSQMINIVSLSQFFSINLIKNKVLENEEGVALLEKLNGTSIDAASAWVAVPEPSEKNFPYLWTAKVFGREEELKDYLRYRWGVADRLPLIKIGYSQKEELLPEDSTSKEFKNFLFTKFIPDLVNNNTFELVIKSKLPDWYSSSEKRKPIPLSKWEEKVGWPNATYAIDATANNWPSPILVADPEDNIRDTHVKYLEDWVARFRGSRANATLPTKKELASLKRTNTDYVYKRLDEDWRKNDKNASQQIICTPLMMAQGLGISDEVVLGPNVSTYGLLAILPEKTPLVYKKMLAYVFREYSGLEALDYYTVGSGERALISFDIFKSEGHIQSPEDQKILQGFENWIKNLQIKFHSPSEEDLKKFGMKIDYRSSQQTE